jgi:hypothetical protein
MFLRTTDVRFPAVAAAALFALAVAAPGQAASGPPVYTNYTAPAPLGQSAGEPSLGVNWNTGNVMFIASLQTLRVTFNDAATPATATWTDVSYPLTSLVTTDPMLFTDPQTGRTFVSQLLGKTSLMAHTDDDGATWTPGMGSGINSGVDHQTVGGGPFAPSPLGGIGYPNVVYYCSQDIALAQCAVSHDGGLTFGPAVPIYTLLQCGGLHGHVKVAPDGTAYVPNKGCSGQQGVAVSTNNGLTWTVRKIPGTVTTNSDPAAGVADDGTVYIGTVSNGRPVAAVSRDQGRTWSAPVDVGVPFGIRNAVFPAVVAGDPDRAAFAFLGTPAAGDGTAESATFAGVWHLYIATTYDGGSTWTTVDATPNDPVQRGSICMSGSTCGATRNLLDFMDIAVDAQGRVLVGYADGCVGSCVAAGPNSFTSIGTIARQSGGKGLFASFD